MTKYYNIINNKIVKLKIDEAMQKAKETGREHGFNICLNRKDITATDVEEGDRNSVKIKNKCPEMRIGSFHIHTRGKNVTPSPADIANIRQKDEFFCIGVNVKSRDRKIIKCFDNEDFF